MDILRGLFVFHYEAESRNTKQVGLIRNMLGNEIYVS